MNRCKIIPIRLPLRRMIAILLTVLLVCGSASLRSSAEAARSAALKTEALPSDAASGVFELPIEVEYCQTEARSELAMINALRTGEDAWYWNENTTEKIYFNNLAALQYDYDLEKVAMQRAAEIAVYYSHIRPDDNDCFQTYDDLGYVNQSAGENIAAGYGSAEQVFVGWAEEEEDYTGQGHRRNMLDSSVTAVGCACVCYEGVYYWVQNFASPARNTVKTPASDAKETRNVQIRNEYADQWTLSETELNICCSESADILELLRVNYQLSISGWDYAQAKLRESMLTPDWQPEDPAIVSYKDGVLTGKSVGKTTMTATLPDGGTELSVTVNVTQATSEHHWQNIRYDWLEDLSQVTASADCSHCDELLTETVKTTSRVTKQPTYEAEGETTYTAVFKNKTFATQNKTVSIPKLVKPDGPDNPFVDVREGSYCYDPVLWAVHHDPLITNGTDATHFSPDAACTRAQVVTFLWRAKGCPEPRNRNTPFSDVKSSDYFFDAVLWAVENGITTGTSLEKFSPKKACTRAQVVTFLWRAGGMPAPAAANNPFTDVPAGQYYTNAVLWAVGKGVTSGTGASSFSPDKTCTRGQIVTFLYRDLA